MHNTNSKMQNYIEWCLIYIKVGHFWLHLLLVEVEEEQNPIAPKTYITEVYATQYVTFCHVYHYYIFYLIGEHMS